MVRRFVDVGSGAVVPRDETTGAPDCRWAVIGGERSRDPELTSDWSRWEEDSTPRKRVYVEEKNGRKIFKVEKIKRL